MSAKKRKDKYWYMAIIIFIAISILRISISLQTQNFEKDAYFTYRQTESIAKTLLPTYVDDLSFRGRTLIFQPLYYYLLAPFAWLMGTTLALKIIPNILASLLVLVTYLIVEHITKNKPVALFSGFAAGTIPAFFTETINTASGYTLTIPLTMYIIYCFMRNKEKTYLYQFIILSIILSLTSAIAFLLVVALIIYLILTRLEYKTENKRELELIMFLTFLVIWVNILIYKKAFLFHSYAVIWQNLPKQILNNFFKEVTIFNAVNGVGIIPLFLGVYAIHKYLLKEKDRRTYLLMAFALGIAMLLWFKLISFNTGLMFLGATLVPLFGQATNSIFEYLAKTRISKTWPLFAATLVILFVLTSTIPAVGAAIERNKKAVTEGEIDALKFLKNNTEEGAVVLGTIDEGFMITAIAKRKNVADNNFLLIRNPEEIYDDIETIYKAIFKTKAVELLNKYDVDYIYFSPEAKKEFRTEKLKFIDKQCFEKVYDKEVVIYKTKCMIKKAN